MIIRFSGAARTVTGSQLILEINGEKLLLECGLYQGKRDETYIRNRTFPYNPAKVDAAILSHAHIDHSGNLPNLIKGGFYGRIYTTPPTLQLVDLMVQDSGHIQEQDVQYVNKKRLRKGEPPVEPLYTIEEASRVKGFLQPVEYGEEFYPVKGVTARLVDAGHILGSAAVVLDIEEKGRKFRLWFSGDIGRLRLPLLKDPVLPEAADYLVMECTYGDKPHRDPEAAYVEFRDVVRKTVRRGGKVIIPAFAVGRTQELVYDLNRMIAGGELPSVPVFVDSPLAVNATDIFRRFPRYYDDETHEFERTGRHQALTFDQLTYTRSVEESKALNERHEPMIIISASGMAESGRILHHLKNNIENPKNTVAIVSWQAPNTLGRRLADRENVVRIYGETYYRAAEVETIGGLSAHAGQDMLLQYAQASRASLKQIFLVHGEPLAANAFMQKLSEAGAAPHGYPELGDFVEI